MALTLHDKLALVTVAEDVAWTELLERSGLARHIVAPLSPRAVLIEPPAVDALVAWLRKNGYLPKVVAA